MTKFRNFISNGAKRNGEKKIQVSTMFSQINQAK